jgi:hypothetical protein
VGDDLFDRHRALRDRHPHVAQQLSSQSRDASKNGALKRWGDDGLVDHKKDVHDAALFNVGAAGSVEPENSVKSGLASLALDEQGWGVITCGFYLTGTTRERADVVLADDYFDRSGEAGSKGKGEDHQRQVSLAFTRTERSTENRQDGYIKALGSVGTPIPGQVAPARATAQPLYKNLFGELWHRDSRGRAIQSDSVLRGAKQRHFTFCCAVGFEAFKHGDTVLETRDVRQQRQRSVAANRYLVPRPLAIGRRQHVIAKDAGEG